MDTMIDLERSSKRLASHYRNLICKLASYESHLQFLTDCCDHQLVPTGFRLGIIPTTEREMAWLEKSQIERLRITRLDAHDKVYRTKARLRGILGSLERRGIRQDHITWIIDEGRSRSERMKRKLATKKSLKLHRLLFETGPLTYTCKARKLPKPTESSVINLSASPLSDSERQVLTLGLKFAPPPSHFPSLELAAKCQWTAELATNHASRLGNAGEDLTQFLNSAEKILCAASKRPFRKLPEDLHRALIALKKDNERVFVRADKAKSVVVLDRRDYTAALLQTLEAPMYEEVNEDPAERYARDFNTTHLLTAFAGPARRGGGNRLRGLADVEKRIYQQLSQSHGRCGAVYAMIKTHKFKHPPRNEEERIHWIRNLKVRPIVPGYRSVDFELSKHLTSCLQALSRPPHSIDGPSAVFDLLARWSHMAKRITLISLDVVSMFPSINIDEAIPLIRSKFETHKESMRAITPLTPNALADLLKLCMENTHAVVRDGDRERFFLQKKGLAMGKAFSPCVADLVIGEWEANLKSLAALDGGHVWDFVRYADDFLVMWEGSEDQLSLFIRRLNEQQSCIKVEVEMEKERKLPFLDILINRSEEGFTTSVYRKPSNSGQVTPYSSFTHPNHLLAAVRSDAFRAFRYSSSLKERQIEVKRLEATYTEYGFPLSTVRKEIKKCFASLELKKKALPAPPSLVPAQPVIRVSLPYTGNSFHQLKRAAVAIGMELVAKPLSTLGSIIASKAKHRLSDEQTSGVVYAIRCDCSTSGISNIYIGETERELQTRIKEHQDGWRKGSGNSAFGSHQHCQPNFDQSIILARQPHKRLRLLYESAYIRVGGRRETIIVSPNDASINRNSGTIFDQRFLPLVQDICRIPPRKEDE